MTSFKNQNILNMSSLGVLQTSTKTGAGSCLLKMVAGTHTCTTAFSMNAIIRRGLNRRKHMDKEGRRRWQQLKNNQTISSGSVFKPRGTWARAEIAEKRPSLRGRTLSSYATEGKSSRWPWCACGAEHEELTGSLLRTVIFPDPHTRKWPFLHSAEDSRFE